MLVQTYGSDNYNFRLVLTKEEKNIYLYRNKTQQGRDDALLYYNTTLCSDESRSQSQQRTRFFVLVLQKDDLRFVLSQFLFGDLVVTRSASETRHRDSLPGCTCPNCIIQYREYKELRPRDGVL